MDWSSTIYAGIGGALGGLLASLISQKISNKSWKSIIVVVCVIFLSRGTNTLYKNGTFPRIIPLDTSEITRNLPALAALKGIDEAEFDKLISYLDIPIRQGRQNDKDLAKFRAAYRNLILKYRSNTKTEVLRAFNIVVVNQTKTFKKVKPEICTLQLHGRAFGDVSNIIPSQQQNEEQAVMARMFAPENTLSEGTQFPDITNGETLFVEIIQAEVRAMKLQNADPAPIDSGGTIEAHKSICDLTVAFTLKFNQLSDDDLRDVSAYQNSVGN